MASYYTSDTLIDSVKRRASIPSSQSTFEDEDFLAFANEEVVLGILPTIMQLHEEYLVYPATIPLVADQSSYAIPSRAVGNKLRNVQYVDEAGSKYELTRIQPEDEPYFQEGGAGGVTCFYLQNNMIILVPEVAASASGNLVVTYFQRPNQLVATSRAAAITAIDRTTGVLTVARVPTGMAAATLVDFIETKGGHRAKGIDVALTATSSTSVTVAPADIPSDLVVGDYVNFAEETVIPQLPDDLHVMLAQRVAARCLESLGDQAGLSAANIKIQEMETKTATLVDNRSEGTPQKVINLRGTLPRRRGR